MRRNKKSQYIVLENVCFHSFVLRFDISLIVSHVANRCSCSLLCGPYQNTVGRVGRALSGCVLCYRCGVCLSYGLYQQYLVVLCWLCYLQSLVHVPHHNHNVS